MGKKEKKWKENLATKVTKIPKTKKTKIWDERNKKYKFWAITSFENLPPLKASFGVSECTEYIQTELSVREWSFTQSNKVLL